MFYRNFWFRVLVLAWTVALLSACGGGGGAASADTSTKNPPTLNNQPSVPAVRNLLSVTVDAGPAGTGGNVNRLYANVTVCFPGSITRCQTIDHVLVDTGSAGLRLLSSVMAPALNLNRLTSTSGQPLLNCAQFVDNSFAWGPVAIADVVLAGRSAASVPIQVMADPAFNSLVDTCSVGGTAITTAAILGANGILGLGLFKEDCGAGCEVTTANGFYYTCTDPGCAAVTGARVSRAQQVKNPVPLFAADNNGVMIDLPSVSSDGAAALTGALIFGIGTQSNNQFTPGAVLTTGSTGYISTSFAGRNFSNSFLDTGSNAYFFDSTTLPTCAGSSAGFYCPSARTSLSATLSGLNGVVVPMTFEVDNALALFAGSSRTALPTLSGPIGRGRTFDWGLPFFYGRRVLMGIEGQPSPLGAGPFYAF